MSSEELKNEGNEHFKASRFDQAIYCFTEAIKQSPSNHILYSNRSSAYFNTKQYPKALKDANKTVQLAPDWPKGYLRQGMALLALRMYYEGQNAFQKGLQVDPQSTELQKGLKLAQFGLQTSNLLKEGIWAQVPVAYEVHKPHPIHYDLVDTFTDILVARGVCGLWTGNGASEITRMSHNEVLEFTQRVVNRCTQKGYDIQVIAGVKGDCSDLKQLASNIQELYKTGVRAVVLDLSNLVHLTDSEETLLKNLTSLVESIGSVPVGLCESRGGGSGAGGEFTRIVSPSFIDAVMKLQKVHFFIDNSGSPVALEDKFNIISGYHCGVKVFTGNATSFFNSMELGISGFAGEQATFLAKLFVLVWKHFKRDASTSKVVHYFLSISEPTMRTLFPLNLKIFLKIHENLNQLEGITRHPLPSTPQEDNFTRITQFEQALKFVENELDQQQQQSSAKKQS